MLDTALYNSKALETMKMIKARELFIWAIFTVVSEKNTTISEKHKETKENTEKVILQAFEEKEPGIFWCPTDFLVESFPEIIKTPMQCYRAMQTNPVNIYLLSFSVLPITEYWRW